MLAGPEVAKTFSKSRTSARGASGQAPRRVGTPMCGPWTWKKATRAWAWSGVKRVWGRPRKGVVGPGKLPHQWRRVRGDTPNKAAASAADQPRAWLFCQQATASARMSASSWRRGCCQAGSRGRASLWLSARAWSRRWRWTGSVREKDTVGGGTSTRSAAAVKVTVARGAGASPRAGRSFRMAVAAGQPAAVSPKGTRVTGGSGR